jgi:hypothetical protein
MPRVFRVFNLVPVPLPQLFQLHPFPLQHQLSVDPGRFRVFISIVTSFPDV